MTEPTDLPQASSTTSEADADHEGDTQSPDHQRLAGISDEKLPEDLQPGEDNPLAEPLDPEAEGTKDADELGMGDTQADTTGEYHSDGDLESSDSTSADSGDETDETDPESVSGDGAQGAGITG